MNLLKLILVIFGVLIFMGSSAQLTTQKKIVSRLNNDRDLYGSKTFDLRDNGTLLVLNFVRDSLSYYSLPDFAVIRGTYLVRLDNNFDTVWTKVIYNYYTTDCLLNKDNKIILLGRKYALNGTQLRCGLNLLKLDLNGNQIKSAYYNNDGISCSFNNTSYYYETIFDNAYISEYRDNAYMVFYYGFFKFNDNLDLVDKKLYPSIVPNHSFRTGNSLFNLNDSTLITTVYSPLAFPASPYIANYAILVIDTQMIIKKYFKVDNPFTFIGSIQKCNNNIFFNGATSGNPTGSIDGLNFLGSIDLNNFSGNGKKRILRYKPEYCVGINNGSSSLFKVKNNKLYSLVDLGNFSNVNDSIAGLNNRQYMYCFDTGLNIIWSKRLHLFNSLDTLPPDTYNSTLYLSTAKKPDFLFKANNIILSNYDYQQVYNAGPYFKRSNFGFNLSSIDTSGNNALCNATIFNSYLMEDSLGFLNLPIPVAGNNFLPQFIPNTVTIDNFPPQQIVQKCLPVKPPVSKFKMSIPGGQAICVNTNIYITEYSYNEPQTWQWIFPPEADVSSMSPVYFPYVRYVKFTQAGVFPIKLVTTNNAGTDTLTQYVTVINFIPQPHLGNDTTICNGDSVRIIYHDPPNSAHYFTGPGIYTTSDTLVIRDSGRYIIAAYTACGYLYDTINVHVIFKPAAKFGYTATCGNLTVAFTDSTKLNGNTSISYQYAWKPALAPPSSYTNYSTQPNNSFTFAAYDSFDVRLIVTGTGGCGVRQDTFVRRIVLKATPVAACSAVTNCGSLQAAFTSAATISAGSITQQEYYVGNTLIGTGASFTYNFAAYGSYTVKQVVKSNFNCISDTFLLPVIIKDKPQVNLIIPRDSVCSGPYTITANATVNATTISSFVWLKNNVVLPNNTNIITETNPTGIYSYKLVATSAQGCRSDTAVKTITVISKPTAVVNATTTCGSKNIAITASASVINDAISSHYIIYGDGNAAAINPNNTTYTYAGYGTYNLKYVVQSSIGCASDTAYQTIEVSDKFVTNIGYNNNACNNSNYILTANTSIGTASINSYTWLRNGIVLPGNTGTLTENNPTGTYTYKLAVSSSNGCSSDTAMQVVVVQNYPTVSFTANSTCVGKTITIANNSSANNSSATYLWTTSDGQTSSAAIPANFVFTTSGNKTIQLKISSPNGCAASSSQNITIDAYPIAAFDITETCLGQNIVISNTSTGAIASYAWQTSNAQQSSSMVPTTFVFNTPGSYSIKLDVATANNCSASITKNTPIQPVQLFVRPAIDTNVNVNQPLQLSISGAATYNWLPFTNLTNAGSSNPVFKSAAPGIYPLTVQATTAQGCKASATLTIKVFAAGNYLFIPNAFTPDGNGLNDHFNFTCAGLKSLSFFRIYNRYGQIVFQQNNCNGNGWDGTFGGKSQPGGAYVYNWQGVAFNGQTVSGNGTVVLVR